MGLGLGSTGRVCVLSLGVGLMSRRGSGALLTAVGFTFPALGVGVVEDGGGVIVGDVGGVLSVLSSATVREVVLVGTAVVVLGTADVNESARGTGAGGGGETGGGAGGELRISVD
jgi:hypothetical protein